MEGEGNKSASESWSCDEGRGRSGKARDTLPGGPIVVVMKGHGCTGKTTLARELAASLLCHGYECSLLSYHDVQSSIHESLGPSSDDSEIREDLPLQILLRVASRELSAILKSPPPRLSRFLGASSWIYFCLVESISTGHRSSWRKLSSITVVVECQPSDEIKWREWSEGGRASSAWEDIQKEISEYEDYSMNGIPHLVVDTTDAGKSAEDHAVDVMMWISSYYQNPSTDPRHDLTIENAGSCHQASWRHFSHHM